VRAHYTLYEFGYSAGATWFLFILRATRYELSMGRSIHYLYYVAAGGGALLWLGTMAVSGRNEAWDSPLYWSIAYPLCLLLAGVIGYVEPVRPWRFALALMWVQPVVMIFTSGSSFSLLPLGVIMFGILALPAIMIARISAWLRLRLARE
jgi:hypothetical protein